MNPCVLRQGDEYWLFYAGADRDGRRRICLAIAPISELTRWRRVGPLFDLGGPGAFDEQWCVLPCLHRFGSTWHLYYTGFSGESAQGLQAFRGIGLATSTDLHTWRKHPGNPVLDGRGFPEWPDNRGVAGAGNILELPATDGPRYRLYYTLSTGRPDPGGDTFRALAKQSVCAHSDDGLVWSDKRVLLRPRRECDYEDVGVIGLQVWRTDERYRAIYSALGSRTGGYALCEARSDDGLTWDRGQPGENLALAPTGTGWERDMVEYPAVVPEEGRLRLFYCGNGFGATGIGTATSELVA